MKRNQPVSVNPCAQSTQKKSCMAALLAAEELKNLLREEGHAVEFVDALQVFHLARVLPLPIAARMQDPSAFPGLRRSWR